MPLPELWKGRKKIAPLSLFLLSWLSSPICCERAFFSLTSVTQTLGDSEFLRKTLQGLQIKIVDQILPELNNHLINDPSSTLILPQSQCQDIPNLSKNPRQWALTVLHTLIEYAKMYSHGYYYDLEHITLCHISLSDPAHYQVFLYPTETKHFHVHVDGLFTYPSDQQESSIVHIFDAVLYRFLPYTRFWNLSPRYLTVRSLISVLESENGAFLLDFNKESQSRLLSSLNPIELIQELYLYLQTKHNWRSSTTESIIQLLLDKEVNRTLSPSFFFSSSQKVPSSEMQSPSLHQPDSSQTFESLPFKNPSFLSGSSSKKVPAVIPKKFLGPHSTQGALRQGDHVISPWNGYMSKMRKTHFTNYYHLPENDIYDIRHGAKRSLALSRIAGQDLLRSKEIFVSRNKRAQKSPQIDIEKRSKENTHTRVEHITSLSAKIRTICRRVNNLNNILALSLLCLGHYDINAYSEFRSELASLFSMFHKRYEPWFSGLRLGKDPSILGSLPNSHHMLKGALLHTMSITFMSLYHGRAHDLHLISPEQQAVIDITAAILKYMTAINYFTTDRSSIYYHYIHMEYLKSIYEGSLPRNKVSLSRLVDREPMVREGRGALTTGAYALSRNCIGCKSAGLIRSFISSYGNVVIDHCHRSYEYSLSTFQFNKGIGRHDVEILRCRSAETKKKHLNFVLHKSQQCYQYLLNRTAPEEGNTYTLSPIEELSSQQRFKTTTETEAGEKYKYSKIMQKGKKVNSQFLLNDLQREALLRDDHTAGGVSLVEVKVIEGEWRNLLRNNHPWLYEDKRTFALWIYVLSAYARALASGNSLERNWVEYTCHAMKRETDDYLSFLMPFGQIDISEKVLFSWAQEMCDYSLNGTWEHSDKRTDLMTFDPSKEESSKLLLEEEDDLKFSSIETLDDESSSLGIQPLGPMDVLNSQIVELVEIFIGAVADVKTVGDKVSLWKLRLLGVVGIEVFRETLYEEEENWTRKANIQGVERDMSASESSRKGEEMKGDELKKELKGRREEEDIEEGEWSEVKRSCDNFAHYHGRMNFDRFLEYGTILKMLLRH